MFSIDGPASMRCVLRDALAAAKAPQHEGVRRDVPSTLLMLRSAAGASRSTHEVSAAALKEVLASLLRDGARRHWSRRARGEGEATPASVCRAPALRLSPNEDGAPCAPHNPNPCRHDRISLRP